VGEEGFISSASETVEHWIRSTTRGNRRPEPAVGRPGAEHGPSALTGERGFPRSMLKLKLCCQNLEMN